MYSHSTKYICTQVIILHPATVYLYSIKELYLFNFKEKIYLLTVKGILILSNNIYLFKKSIIIRGNYILTRNHIHFKEPYQFVQGNISSFSEIYSFRGIYLFKEHIFVQVQRHMFIQGNYIYWTLFHSQNSRNIYSKIVPSHFMIIVSFTITISWIKYSYNFFQSVEGWRNCWYDRGFRIIITVRVVFATIVGRNTTRSASRFRHYIFAKIWYARQRAVYI